MRVAAALVWFVVVGALTSGCGRDGSGSGTDSGADHSDSAVAVERANPELDTGGQDQPAPDDQRKIEDRVDDAPAPIDRAPIDLMGIDIAALDVRVLNDVIHDFVAFDVS